MFQFFRLDRGGGNVGLHPPKMRSCAVLTSRSWLADVWDRTEEGATAEVTGNWGTTKNTSNIKIYILWKAQNVVWVDTFIVFNTRFCLSFLSVKTFEQTTTAQARVAHGPFVHYLYLTAELTADRWAVCGV